ncbi:hypothetical protein BDW66DRAFT_140067 [Aspergillus desertorum]
MPGTQKRSACVRSGDDSFKAKAVATLISSLLSMIAFIRLQRYLRNIDRITFF